MTISQDIIKIVCSVYSAHFFRKFPPSLAFLKTAINQLHYLHLALPTVVTTGKSVLIRFWCLQKDFRHYSLHSQVRRKNSARGFDNITQLSHLRLSPQMKPTSMLVAADPGYGSQDTPYITVLAASFQAQRDQRTCNCTSMTQMTHYFIV